MKIMRKIIIIFIILPICFMSMYCGLLFINRFAADEYNEVKIGETNLINQFKLQTLEVAKNTYNISLVDKNGEKYFLQEIYLYISSQNSNIDVNRVGYKIFRSQGNDYLMLIVWNDGSAGGRYYTIISLDDKPKLSKDGNGNSIFFSCIKPTYNLNERVLKFYPPVDSHCGSIPILSQTQEHIVNLSN